ncbi:MAG: AAA family ATPase [Syntrophomonadaceae bacterium]|nr:AAA family ATPase [Syntrophomonadaceae bacterium]
MKILELEVSGYRSLKKVNWKPGDLNILIGPNGAGKSNLLRLLQLISISARGELASYIQDAGGMEPLMWDGSAKKITIRIIGSPLDEGRDVDRESLRYELEINRLGKSSSYRIDYELLCKHDIYAVDGIQSPFKFLERVRTHSRVFNADQRALAAPEDTVPEDESLLSAAGGPFSVNPFITSFQRELKGWSIYHDIHVNQDAPIRQAVVTKLERRVNPDGQNLINVLHTLYTSDREFKKNINLAMRAAFGDDFEELVFPPAADERIQLRVRWKTLKREQSASELSDGTLRFLMLLTILSSPDAAPVIAIDEPETGLHPAMLPIIAEYAIEAAERSQIIFTTHSPDFLDAFGDFTPVTSVVVWENGETVIRRLDEKRLQYWLQDYSLGKLFTSGELEGMI